MYIKINEATNYIKTQYHGKIDLAIILGSGLGPLADDGHGKAEHLSGLARHPRAGLVRIVCSSHGLMEMKGENHGRDSLSPS